MKNTIEARLSFSYKGEDFNLTSEIDLDALMTQDSEVPDIYSVLARENNIDTYSYLYEVMTSYEITYHNTSKKAASCLTGNDFDFSKFRTLWQEQLDIQAIEDIANKHLNIADLTQHPKLKTALLEALKHGRKITNVP